MPLYGWHCRIGGACTTDIVTVLHTVPLEFGLALPLLPSCSHTSVVADCAAADKPDGSL